jgi:transcription-repair coupling factor (superfamily II helicase)
MADGQIVLTVGSFEGYDMIMGRCALISMAEDEGARVMANRRRQRILKKVGGAERIMSHADLSVGDYVVHSSYGIGLFEGIESVRVDGVTKDYITIKYAGTDKLFVPCDRLESIGKYIGDKASDGSVKLSKMGGTEWHKTKARAKSSAKDIAKKLITLYAERQRSQGFAFSPDNEMELEFADSFPFAETPSQLQAIDEIKSDMMRPVPMNRLLCGDVGFGKTEVALRAAFKAVMDGKQVAFLVPTTILALQHYETAMARFRGYPVTVEMLSRFRTPKEQKSIRERCERGAVDILIGTHKLFSKQLSFRDLGLLIVDEEQRFGVAQKEKLKEMRENIDVLTLSATPIPRTLNMAMNGIADMSVLDDAPEDRHPVQTYVLEHDEAVIHDAINREISRGGQVLYLYNNTSTIDFVAHKIMTAIPTARVAYAHGQMDKDDLEDIWGALVRQDIDVLVCTTIIETGVDLPNANTLIIEDADKMGLSQLHQIRGRVGRSRRQAYAYFTYRPGKALSEVATKRLSAIREYAEFGAGFKVALRDLEIRGAGNLLGAEQHGYIDSVGYDLYVRLLQEAVAEERGEVKKPLFESHIDIRVDAHIPEYFISSSASRMEIYKKISLLREPEEADDIYDEIADRFGDIPKTVERLIDVSLCRAICERAEISRVEKDGYNLRFYMDKCDLSLWSEIIEKHKGRLMGCGGKAPIFYKLTPKDEPLKALRQVLSDLLYAMREEKK